MPAKASKKAKGAAKAPVAKAKPAKRPSPLVLKLRSWLFRPTPLIVTAFVVSIAVMSPYIPHLLPDLTSLDEYQFELKEIEVNSPNQWVPGTLLENVLVQSSLPEKVSLLDHGLCRDIAVAFTDNPWIEDVQSVRLTNERTVRTLLTYREPVAFIRTKNGLLPVDVDGVLLPAADFKMEDIDRLPHIENVRSSPRGRVGEPWGDVVVESAARIAAALAPERDMSRYWERFELKSIVAPDFVESPLAAEELTFELATTGGSRIVWGKPPGADDLEPSVEQKIGRMEQYLSRFGKFDEPNGPYRIDIRLFDAISLEPLDTRVYR